MASVDRVRLICLFGGLRGFAEDFLDVYDERGPESPLRSITRLRGDHRSPCMHSHVLP
jgi:hypothetical protein